MKLTEKANYTFEMSSAGNPAAARRFRQIPTTHPEPAQSPNDYPL
jgi:hypothetical protein